MRITGKKWLNLLIKLIISILLMWALYRQVFAKDQVNALWMSLVEHFEFPNLLWLLLVILLAPVNMVFEALKWKVLVKNFTALSFWNTLKAVLAGTTIAIFTPNRIGEYGGRILFVEPEHNWKAVIATLVGSLAQLLVLLSLGLTGLVVFSTHYLQPGKYILLLFSTLTISLIALLGFCFFNIDLIVPIARRIPGIYRFQKYFKHLMVLTHYTTAELKQALFFAFFRYLTYSFQYYFLLQFYGIAAPVSLGLAGIATIFFVQASIPLPPLMGLLARGEIALFVWGIFSENEINILAATFSLFVINIAVPALLGLVFIIQTNIVQTLGYENGVKK